MTLGKLIVSIAVITLVYGLFVFKYVREYQTSTAEERKNNLSVGMIIAITLLFCAVMFQTVMRFKRGF